MNTPSSVEQAETSEESRLTALHSYHILDTLPEKYFDDIVRLVSQICDVPAALISLSDTDRQWFKAKVGFDRTQITREMSFCAYALEKNDLFIVPDTALDTRFAENPLVTDSPNVRFYAGAPLLTPEGHALGTLCAIDVKPRTLTPDQQESLVILSRHVMAQFELPRQSAAQDKLMQDRRKVTERLRLLEAAVEKANDVILITEAEPFDSPGPRIVYVNPAFTRMTGYTAEEVLGKTPRILQGPDTDPEVNAKIRAKLEKWQPMQVEVLNYRKDGTKFWSELNIAPIANKRGWYTHWISIQRDVTARRADREKLDQTNIELECRVQERTSALASANAALQAEIAERKVLEVQRETMLKEALERADVDSLTGLWNHRGFQKRLEAEADRAQRTGCQLVLAMIDVDNFKFFNDVYGHPIGDEVLCQVAQALRASCRSYDTLARFGGDEFALLASVPEAEDAPSLAERLTTALASLGYTPPGYDTVIPIGASFGMAIFMEEAVTRLELIELADRRLRDTKAGGGTKAMLVEGFRTQFANSRSGFSMLSALVNAVDVKDRYTCRHSEDVMLHSLRIAQALGLDEATQQTVAVAALLHDVGKIGVPDDILRKPGYLTPAEFEAIQQHPVMGANIVGAVSGFEEALGAISHHHERWDGKGYPGGLQGEQTPLLARLMAVADAYSAMTTDRPYRKGMIESKAFQILQEGAGTQWDPRCVRAFLAEQAPKPFNPAPAANPDRSLHCESLL
ncbi:MAG: HD domain-containing phosphohydrolase [Janthinobacterium lividum]